MERPKFSIKANSDGTYTGKWDQGEGKTISMLFDDSKDALKIESIVSQAWEAGINHGRRQVCLKVFRVIEDFNVI